MVDGVVENDDEVNVDVHVDSNWASGPERKSTCGGIEALVQNTSDACTEHGGSLVLRSRQGRSGGPWDAVDDGRLGPKRAGAGLDLLKRCQGNSVETRSRTDENVELRYLWVQEVTKSGRVKMRRMPGAQNPADHLTKGKAWHQIETLIRGVGGIMKMSGDNKGSDERKK